MKINFIPSALALAFLAAAASAHSQLIGVQFQGGGYRPLDPSTMAGLIPQDHFNVITGEDATNATLVNSSGDLVSGVTLTLSSGNSYYTETASNGGDYTLLSGKLTSPTSTSSFTLNGLAPGSYNLILYTVDNTNNGVGGYTVGNTTYDVVDQNGSDFNGTYVRGTSTSAATASTANYVEFAGIAVDASGTLTMKAANATGYYSADFNGFQLDEVPEPSTWAAMLGGLALLALVLRRRRAPVA